MPAPSPGLGVPDTVKPARSSVIPLVPTMMPLLVQLLTGPASVVSMVIVWPQLTNTGAAPAGDATTTAATPSMPTTRPTRSARARTRHLPFAAARPARHRPLWAAPAPQLYQT